MERGGGLYPGGWKREAEGSGGALWNVRQVKSPALLSRRNSSSDIFSMSLTVSYFSVCVCACISVCVCVCVFVLCVMGRWGSYILRVENEKAPCIDS